MNPGAHVIGKISHPSLTHGLIYLTIRKEMYSSMHRIIAKEHYDCKCSATKSQLQVFTITDLVKANACTYC